MTGLRRARFAHGLHRCSAQAHRPPMTNPTPSEPGASLARIDRTPTGYVIDCCGPMVACHYDFRSVGEAAEFAQVLRDSGNWPLRFGRGADEIREIVAELDACAE